MTSNNKEFKISEVGKQRRKGRRRKRMSESRKSKSKVESGKPFNGNYCDPSTLLSKLCVTAVFQSVSLVGPQSGLIFLVRMNFAPFDEKDEILPVQACSQLEAQNELIVKFKLLWLVNRPQALVFLQDLYRNIRRGRGKPRIGDVLKTTIRTFAFICGLRQQRLDDQNRSKMMDTLMQHVVSEINAAHPYPDEVEIRQSLIDSFREHWENDRFLALTFLKVIYQEITVNQEGLLRAALTDETLIQFCRDLDDLRAPERGGVFAMLIEMIRSVASRVPLRELRKADRTITDDFEDRYDHDPEEGIQYLEDLLGRIRVDRSHPPNSSTLELIAVEYMIPLTKVRKADKLAEIIEVLRMRN